MARPKAKAPARRYHISGQSVVTIAGSDFYLGPHDSPKAIERYAVLIALYQKHGLTLPRERYDAASYRQAIQRAAETAGVPKWHPYQIRHVTATEVRAALGLEDAKALLGHSTALMTAHYQCITAQGSTLC